MATAQELLEAESLAHALGVRARPALDQAGQTLNQRVYQPVGDALDMLGYSLASGTAGLVDRGTNAMGAGPIAVGNFVGGLLGLDPITVDRYAAQRWVEGFGPPEVAVRNGWTAFPAGSVPLHPIAQAQAQQVPWPAVIPDPETDALALRAAGPVAAAVPPAAAATAIPPTTGGPVVSSMTGAPVVDASVTETLNLAPSALPDVRVTTDVGGLPVPMRCRSGVCRPDIESGGFYANAEQSAFARNGAFGETAWDRMGPAMQARFYGVGPGEVLRNEQAQRAMMVNDLRLTPEYQETITALLPSVGGRRDLAQSLADQRFFGQDAQLNLALTENDTSPLIDQASSQRAALAALTGDPTVSNPLSAAAQGAGYWGAAGGLPVGTADGRAAVLTPGGTIIPAGPTAGLTGPALAAAGGAAGVQARADAGNQALLAANASSQAAMAQQLRLQDQIWRNSPEGQLEIARARAQGRSEGTGGLSTADILLLNQASGN